MIYSKIAGTGGYTPNNVVTNYDLAKKVETDHDWIVQRTGIHSRCLATAGETTSSMSFEAASKAINAAGIQATDLDLIILATTTPDKILPTASCMLQEKLGVPNIPAFDLGAACAGFIYAISVADQFIRAGNAKNILVVGAEHMSSIVDWSDRTTCVLFGDGAGAVVLQASDSPGILSTHLHADGRHGDKLFVPTGLPNLAIADEPAYVNMRGQEVFKFAVKALGDIVDETLDDNNMDKSDIDWLIPHQANLRIITATAKKLDMSMEKVILTVDKHANTSAASIPLALDEGVRDGRIKRGDKLLMEGIGGGFAWGSALVIF